MSVFLEHATSVNRKHPVASEGQLLKLKSNKNLLKNIKSNFSVLKGGCAQNAMDQPGGPYQNNRDENKRRVHSDQEKEINVR